MRNAELLYDRSTTLPSTSDHLRRPRIDMLLAEAIDRPLVTVTAGAGWGKTGAVSSFLNSACTNFVWIQLSRHDNFTVRFWEGFVYAIGLQSPRLAYRLAAFSFPLSASAFHDFLHALTDSTIGREKFLFVFDDFHLISEPSIIHFVENLLSAHLKNLSVILVGRSLPDIDLHNLRISDISSRITEYDLYFTKQETADYFNMRDLMLPDNLLEQIHAQTGGWISAIYLVSLAIKKHSGIPQLALVMAKRQIFEMLKQEIFSDYSEELRQALIKLSLFDSIPIDFINEYARDTAQQIYEAEKANPFIRFNPSKKTYEIHQLFLEFLTEKQVYLSAEEIKKAHCSVASWYYDHGFKIDALVHYKKSGSYEEIWNIISHYDISISTDMADLFLSLIESFPGDFAGKFPLVPVVHARLLLNNGKIEESNRELLEIINTCEARPDIPGNRAVAGEAYLFMGMISLLSFDYRFVAYYKKANAYLPQGSRLIDHRLSFSDGNYLVLVKAPTLNEVPKFVNAVMEALPYGVKAMNGAAYGMKYATKAEAAYYTRNMKEAEACAYKASCQAEQNAQYDTICTAYFILLRVYISTGSFAKAAGCIAKAKEIMEAPENAAHTKNCIYTRDIMEGWYYARLGDLEKLPSWILRRKKRDKMLSPNNLGRDQFIRAYCLLEEGSYYELSALLAALEDDYDSNSLLLARLETQIYKAIAAHRTGDIPQAMTALKNAYGLAVGNSLSMPFIELGKYMRAVIYTAKRYAANKIPLTWLNEISAKSTTYEKNLNAVKAKYNQMSGHNNTQSIFTKREKEILSFLIKGLTNREIADSLYLSESTVKKALKNVYGKLGASNQVDAVRLALQSGLGRNEE